MCKERLIYVMPNEQNKRLGEGPVRYEAGENYDQHNDKGQDFVNEMYALSARRNCYA
jgi:hypothetical protein